ETVSQKVVATIVGHGEKDLVEVTVDVDGEAGDAVSTLVATAEHPFWVDEHGRLLNPAVHGLWGEVPGWYHAEDLDAGDWLRTPTGEKVRVVDVRTYTATTQVHNLTINGVHTYYVAADSVPFLVHNASCQASKEVVLGSFDTFEKARNKALDLMGEIDHSTRRSIKGRLGSSSSTYGKVVGFETRVGGVYKRFRMDFDPEKGPHINVEVGKGSSGRKWAVPWRGTESEFSRLLGGNT
ncbi:polymorphic toxin-type HINT domain-containing protein, partial [Saccharomonospora glauca]